MATKYWSRVKRGTSGTRIFAAYLALVLVVAMAGPGLAVYAAEGDEVVAEPIAEPIVVDPEPAPEEAPVVAEEPPAREANLPVAEPVESAVLPPDLPVNEVVVPEPSAEKLVTVPPVVAAPIVITPSALVVPVLSGDPNPPLTAGGVRIGDPSDGTYGPADVDDSKPTVPADFEIVIDTYETEAGWFFDWSSNYPISSIVVKGGSAGAYIYTYGAGVYSDTGLHAPANPNGKWAGLSHLDFYFGEDAPPETGDLIVYKFYDTNENGIHDPGEAMLENWAFAVTRETPPLEMAPAAIELVGSGLTDVDGELSFMGLDPGEYVVTETLKPGWTNTTTLVRTVQVVAGETTEVWFGNIEEFLPFTELDLAIRKVADKSTASPGELITYTLTYWNNGDLPAENYTIVDDYDERYVTVVNANGGTVSGGKISWAFAGPLAKADGSKTLTYTVRVIADMPDGTTNVDNVVVIDHPLDADKTNNTDNERVVVRVGEPFLPFTGAESLMLVLLAAVATTLGFALRLRSGDTV